MTDEQKTETAEAFRGYLDGETEFEYLSREGWIHTDVVNAHWPHRRKPKPALVPWDCKADVPLNAWFQFIGESSSWYQPHTISDSGIYIHGAFHNWSKLFSDAMASTDRVNWNPCSKPA